MIEHEDLLHRLHAWNERVDRLIEQVEERDLGDPRVAPRLRALRHKRDRVLVKVHKAVLQRGHGPTQRECLRAEEDLRLAWNSAVLLLRSLEISPSNDEVESQTAAAADRRRGRQDHGHDETLASRDR